MAFRVDDIVVSDKNVMFLHGGKQYIADIEKEQEIANSFNKSRDRNPWNLRTEDGVLLNNIFDIEDFTIRTQVITGSRGDSTNYRRSHESYYMPNPEGYVGNCQFYDNAYSLTDSTKKNFTSTYHTTSGKNTEKYESDSSFIRYDGLSSFDNMVDYYITPDIAFTKTDGIQYMTEYPMSRFYSDFGDNEDNGEPTIYGDSCPLKYYLDSTYSVDSIRANNTKSEFSYFRTYYDIGNTGNSIYLVYRNDLDGTSTLSSNGGTYVDTHKIVNDDYVVSGTVGRMSYMSNITTISNSISGITYASDPYSDFFRYDEMSSVNGFSFIKQPLNLSFALFFKTFSNGANQSRTEVTYLPKNGLDKSKVKYTIGEIVSEANVVELYGSVLIATNSNGLIHVENTTYGIENGVSKISYSPFSNSKIGRPDDENKENIDKDSMYSNFSVCYNGVDILGVTATATVSGQTSKVVLLSTSATASSGTSYGIGRLFMPTGRPDYEMDKTTVEHYSPYTVSISSVPTSYTVSGQTYITYILSSVETRELTGTEEIISFAPSANAIRSGSTVLFDYAPISFGDDVRIGSYAFVQFDGFGLTKIHRDDIYDNENFTRMGSTGPTNSNGMLRSGSVCKDVHFELISYGDSIKSKSTELIDYVGVGNNGSVIYGKPALVTTYKDSSNAYYNSFSIMPLSDDRELITEPLFHSEERYRSVEQCPISSNRFILDKPIENSLGVSVKTFNTRNINHDAAVSLVKWNGNDGTYQTSKDYTSANTDLGGLHLQYSGICTELYITGKNSSDSKVQKKDSYTSSVYEYPHTCFGGMRTAGTGLSIFDGELSSSMRVGDVFMLNDYLIVKNYAVKNNTTNITDEGIGEKVRESGKTYGHDTGSFTSGGYVITNFFNGSESNIQGLYDVKLISSSKKQSKTTTTSETIYDYNYLWHIMPSVGMEFYPASKEKVEWRPYYALKYVDFIKYHNGHYYIALSSAKDKVSGTIGYELIETKDLFTEEKCSKLDNGRYVSGIKFFDDNVAVEYSSSTDSTYKRVMVFKQGKVSSKTYPISYCNTTSFETTETSSINRAALKLYMATRTTDVKDVFDNVEIIHSLNRFNSVVNHKSNMFSIKISDLGLDRSPYLTKTQKKNLKTWFRNRITTIVDSVKPANTQLFDVFID